MICIIISVLNSVHIAGHIIDKISYFFHSLFAQYYCNFRNNLSFFLLVMHILQIARLYFTFYNSTACIPFRSPPNHKNPVCKATGFAHGVVQSYSSQRNRLCLFIRQNTEIVQIIVQRLNCFINIAFFKRIDNLDMVSGIQRR